MAYVDIKSIQVKHEGKTFDLFDEENLFEWATEEDCEEAKAVWSQMAIQRTDNSPMKFDQSNEKAIKVLEVQDKECKAQYGYVVEIKEGSVEAIYVLCEGLGWSETLDINDLSKEEIDYVKAIVAEYYKAIEALGIDKTSGTNEMDIVIQFARLWGIETEKSGEKRRRQLEGYDSEELLKLILSWKNEYLEDEDTEDSVEFFYQRLEVFFEKE